MILERLCYAFSFIAEALTVWLYLDYLFCRKRSPVIIITSFSIGYLFLHIVSLIGDTTVNATSVFIINFLLMRFDFLSSWKTALLHTAFLCFLMAGSEVLPAVFISLFGYEFSAYRYSFHVLVLLAVFSKLLYLMSTTIASRIFRPHKVNSADPQRMSLFCFLPYLSILLTFVFMISMVFPCTAFAAENDDMSKEQVVELAKKVFPEYAEKLENGHTTNRDRSRPVSGEVFAVVKETRAIDDLSTMTYTEHSNGTITLGIARFVKKASYSDVSSETHSAYEQFTATITAYALEGPTFIAKNVVYRIYGSDYDRITSVGNYSTPNYYSHHYNVSVNRTESASTPAYVSYQFISLIGAEERNFDVYFTVQNNVASVDIDIW